LTSLANVDEDMLKVKIENNKDGNNRITDEPISNSEGKYVKNGEKSIDTKKRSINKIASENSTIFNNSDLNDLLDNDTNA